MRANFFPRPIINSLTTNVPHYIKTSQLICFANQLTGFYMMGNIGRSKVNVIENFQSIDYHFTFTDKIFITDGILPNFSYLEKNFYFRDHSNNTYIIFW